MGLAPMSMTLDDLQSYTIKD